jgi:hypothetical protein
MLHVNKAQLRLGFFVSFQHSCGGSGRQVNRISACFLNYLFNLQTKNSPSHEDFMGYNNSLNKLFLFKKRSGSSPCSGRDTLKVIMVFF